VVTELDARVAELAAKRLPDPPVLAWQQRTGRSFAELIDFAEHVEAAARAGLEAALEASGLLAAEVRDDGTLQLADGQLVAAPSSADVRAPSLRRTRVPDRRRAQQAPQARGRAHRHRRAARRLGAPARGSGARSRKQRQCGMVSRRNATLRKRRSRKLGVYARRSRLPGRSS
jgi:hypothetical protein